jgi:hypothetical protein
MGVSSRSKETLLGRVENDESWTVVGGSKICGMERGRGEFDDVLLPPLSLLGLEYRQGYLDIQVYPPATETGRLY